MRLELGERIDQNEMVLVWLRDRRITKNGPPSLKLLICRRLTRRARRNPCGREAMLGRAQAVSTTVRRVNSLDEHHTRRLGEAGPSPQEAELVVVEVLR